MIAAAVQGVSEPVWLFCHPDLREFYERRGFTFDPALPHSKGAFLNIHRVSFETFSFHWSWPLFLGSAALAWVLFTITPE